MNVPHSEPLYPGCEGDSGLVSIVQVSAVGLTTLKSAPLVLRFLKIGLASFYSEKISGHIFFHYNNIVGPSIFVQLNILTNS